MIKSSMRTIKAVLYTLFLGICLVSCAQSQNKIQDSKTNMEAKSFYDFTLQSLNGQEDISLEKYKGKKVLVVNVASRCGYTPQYEQLQELHKQFGGQIAVLGFPANNFGGQEPGTAEEIQEFCRVNYGVTFQMFEKISVKGGDQHPLYVWLSNKEANGTVDQAPSWNFCKYVIDEQGQVTHFFGASADPFGDEIMKALDLE